MKTRSLAASLPYQKPDRQGVVP